jgi:hypothetical protein
MIIIVTAKKEVLGDFLMGSWPFIKSRVCFQRFFNEVGWRFPTEKLQIWNF